MIKKTTIKYRNATLMHNKYMHEIFIVGSLPYLKFRFYTTGITSYWQYIGYMREFIST